jgi:hypothetical protein
MKMDERLATSVCKASRRVTQLYDNTPAPCGLRFTQYSTLAQLATRSEVPTGTKLAEAMVSHRSSLGHAFGRSIGTAMWSCVEERRIGAHNGSR